MQIIKVNYWFDVPQNYTGIVEHADSSKCTFLNGMYHSYDDKPSFVSYNNDKYWHFEGKYHRIDGPAVEFSDGSVEYWCNNKPTTKEALELLQGIMKLKELQCK
jgi:hypothetical protein